MTSTSIIEKKKKKIVLILSNYLEYSVYIIDDTLLK